LEDVPQVHIGVGKVLEHEVVDAARRNVPEVLHLQDNVPLRGKVKSLRVREAELPLDQVAHQQLQIRPLRGRAQRSARLEDHPEVVVEAWRGQLIGELAEERSDLRFALFLVGLNHQLQKSLEEDLVT